MCVQQSVKMCFWPSDIQYIYWFCSFVWELHFAWGALLHDNSVFLRQTFAENLSDWTDSGQHVLFKFKPEWKDGNKFGGHRSFTRRWFNADLYLFWRAASLMKPRRSCVEPNSSLVWLHKSTRCGSSFQLVFNSRFNFSGFSVLCRGCVFTDRTVWIICEFYTLTILKFTYKIMCHKCQNGISSLLFVENKTVFLINCFFFKKINLKQCN